MSLASHSSEYANNACEGSDHDERTFRTLQVGEDENIGGRRHHRIRRIIQNWSHRSECNYVHSEQEKRKSERNNFREESRLHFLCFFSSFPSLTPFLVRSSPSRFLLNLRTRDLGVSTGRHDDRE